MPRVDPRSMYLRLIDVLLSSVSACVVSFLDFSFSAIPQYLRADCCWYVCASVLVEELDEVDPLLLVVCLPSNLACGRLRSIAWARAWMSAQRERGVVSAADPCYNVLALAASPVLDFLFAPHAVIVSGQVVEENYPYFLGFAHLASGLSNGLSGLAAGICIGIVGDAGVRATGQNVRYSVLDWLSALC